MWFLLVPQELVEAVGRASAVVLMTPPSEGRAHDMIGTILAAANTKQKARRRPVGHPCLCLRACNLRVWPHTVYRLLHSLAIADRGSLSPRSTCTHPHTMCCNMFFAHTNPPSPLLFLSHTPSLSPSPFCLSHSLAHT